MSDRSWKKDFMSNYKEDERTGNDAVANAMRPLQRLYESSGTLVDLKNPNLDFTKDLTIGFAD